MKTPYILAQAAKILNESLRNKLKEKGHFNTGQLEGSIKSNISNTELTGEMYDYGHIVDDGTPASRIPFSPGSGAKSSRFIDGLIAFFQTKGLPEKEARSAAFATAKVQKKEGMSTKASVRYSSTGDRNNFIRDALNEVESVLEKTIENGMDEIFNDEFTKQKSERI